MKNIIGELPIKGIAIASAVGSATVTLVLLLFSALISFEVIPYTMKNVCALASVFFGGTIGSVVASSGKQKLISAALSTVLMLAILYFAGAAVFSTGINGIFLTLVLIILLFSCIIGSVISTVIK